VEVILPDGEAGGRQVESGGYVRFSPQGDPAKRV